MKYRKINCGKETNIPWILSLTHEMMKNVPYTSPKANYVYSLYSVNDLIVLASAYMTAVANPLPHSMIIGRHCIVFVNLYSAALSSGHSVALPVQKPIQKKKVSRREMAVGRDPERIVTRREEGRAIHREGPIVAKDL